MRHLSLMVTLVVILLASSAPALAQTAGPDQYSGVGIESIRDGIDDASETAAEGTKAVNEALSEPLSETALPGASAAPNTPAGLTELPETGGASPVLPGFGALMVASGLLVGRTLRSA